MAVQTFKEVPAGSDTQGLISMSSDCLNLIGASYGALDTVLMIISLLQTIRHYKQPI